MTVVIVPATLRDACFVAADMREADRREIDALVSTDNPAAVAWRLLNASGDLCFCAVEDRPVFCFGVSVLFPHIASGWAFGTRRTRRAMPAATRHCLGHIAPTLASRGFRRLEIRAMEENTLSCRWIESMGFTRETPEPFEYGRRGEMFVMFGMGLGQWLRRDSHHVLRRK